MIYAGNLHISKTLLFMLFVIYEVLAQVHHYKSIAVEGAAEESGLLPSNAMIRSPEMLAFNMWTLQMPYPGCLVAKEP